MTTKGRKWTGFLIIIVMLYSWGTALIVYGWINNKIEIIIAALIMFVSGLIGAFGTLVTGTVITDRDTSKNYVPELAEKTDQTE